MQLILVRCFRGDTLLRSYELGWPETLNDAAVSRPTRERLEADAKTNLIDERLAAPPYAGISFKIEFPR